MIKKLILIATLFLATSVWAENDKRPQTEEEMEAWFQAQALINIKDSTQLSCNHNHKRYVRIGNLEDDNDFGEATDYWYLNFKKNVIYSKESILGHALVLSAWRESDEHQWKGRDPAIGQTQMINIDDNQIKMSQAYDDYYLKTNGVDLFKWTRSVSIDRNTGRYTKLNEEWGNEKSYGVRDYTKDTFTGYCVVIDPSKKKF